VDIPQDRWSGPRCPELVAGSGKHVVVVMVAYDVQDVSTLGHVVVGQVTLSHRLCPITDFWPEIIPLPSRLKTMDSDALGLRSFFAHALLRNCYIYRDFLDSSHPLALDGQRYATAASACLKIIFKYYQVPLSCFQRISQHALTSRLFVDMEHLSHQRGVNLQGWKTFLETYFSTHKREGIPAIYAALDFHQRLRSSHLQFLLKKSAYSDNLLNFAHRRVFRFGYLHQKHPKGPFILSPNTYNESLEGRPQSGLASRFGGEIGGFLRIRCSLPIRSILFL
jgi:hypothetical protein